MSAPVVFIDGHAGTTGLRIREYLARRSDIEISEIGEADRKDPKAKAALLNAADLVILCLPDDAAKESVALIENPATRVIDASTAFRTDPAWTYGLPELSAPQRAAIATSTRVSNPGCYPQTVVLALRPLIEGALIASDAPVSIHALSGYTGGGRPLIEKWEDSAGALLELEFEAPYAVDRIHKHVPEMQQFSGLRVAPFFVPAVGPFATGMRVQVPLHASLLAPGVDGATIHGVLAQRYASEPFVRIAPLRTEPLGEKELNPHAVDGTNMIELHVLAHPVGHVLVVGLLDNLGKGAGGSAVQNMNLMLGLEETAGLTP